MAEKKNQEKENGNSKKSINPIQIQQYLAGVSYPLNKQDMMEAAKGNKASRDILDVLDQLPDQEYNSPTDVSRAIGEQNS